ncbi:MAG: 2-oxoglutarate oxidoreductase [Candidatus Zixiibacteriota bacterium]|nr:MAG: 2-oxoglutarate oxidoreductase [candidate division Zixibacteria bacterium]
MEATKTIFQRPEAMTEVVTHYCPGCTHGVIHRIVAEVLDELNLRERTLGVAPVGCAVFAYNYFNTDFLEAAHGRAPAFATGFKRMRPDMIVFTYQGDGDLASIGMGEIVHAANRGEKFTVIFVNNAIYGMTGGQMAPTTLEGQITTTCPYGRDTQLTGQPVRMVELLSSLVTPAYLERVAVHTPQHIIRAKKAVRRAFEYQRDNVCFSLVEFLSTCPTNWGKTPYDATQWLDDNMRKYYPLGCFKRPEPSEAQR